MSVVIITMTAGIALIAVLSAIGVCERCHVSSGGVYYLLAHVLGGRVGAAVGVLYCFGQVLVAFRYVTVRRPTHRSEGFDSRFESVFLRLCLMPPVNIILFIEGRLLHAQVDLVVCQPEVNGTSGLTCWLT